MDINSNFQFLTPIRVYETVSVENCYSIHEKQFFIFTEMFGNVNTHNLS